MKVGIIGVGFVGGATAKVLENAHELYLYDKYKEPYNAKKNLEELAKNSECAFICVPTPMQKNKSIDYTNIHNSIIDLLDAALKFQREPKDILAIIRSTAVSGTTDNLSEKYPFRFAFNPEFLRENHAVEDMGKTDKIIIGTESGEDAQKVMDIYKPIFPDAKYIVYNRKEAEMCKYGNNFVLAAQVAMYNELKKICDAVGVDYNKIKDVILLDPRAGRNADVPGPDGDYGFGGKCLPKDLNALDHLAAENGYEAHLLREIWRTNLKVRKSQDWLDIPGATSQNNFDENKK